MKTKYLNRLYFSYSCGIINRSDLEGEIFRYLLENQDKTNLDSWKPDEYQEFISWFYQRLHISIDSYRESGASFDAYVKSIFRSAAREFRVRNATNSVIESSAWSAQIHDFYVREQAPSYTFDKTENMLNRIFVNYKGRKSPKQILALVLKCYYYVSDDLLDRIASQIGIESSKLSKMLDEIRLKRKKKDDDLYLMKERIYCQFYRCIVYEKRLSYFPENTTGRLIIKKKLEKARTRLEKMRRRMAKIRKDATNKEVAEVIGVSKGTIDSTLHRLKLKWNLPPGKSLLN